MSTFAIFQSRTVIFIILALVPCVAYLPLDTRHRMATLKDDVTRKAVNSDVIGGATIAATDITGVDAFGTDITSEAAITDDSGKPIAFNSDVIHKLLGGKRKIVFHLAVTPHDLERKRNRLVRLRRQKYPPCLPGDWTFC